MVFVNIKIIYDNIDPEKSRTCFWKTIDEKSDDNYKFEFISVGETLDSEKPFKVLELFNKKKTDIIILNWDSINNDMLFGSDRTFQFFYQHSPALKGWVEDGGIVIVEAQTSAWKLIQSSYDIFTRESKDCFVKVNDMRIPENRATINSKLKNTHPLLKEISDNNEWTPVLESQKWFPESYEVYSIDHSEKKLFAGWFDKYSRDWEPLLFADNEKKRPVMLCCLIKTEKKIATIVGGYILTTMYLGASGFNPFIQNLLNFPEFSKTYYIEKVKKEKIARIKKRNKWLKIGFFILIQLILVWAFFSTIINYISPVYNTFKTMLITIITIFIANILFHYFKDHFLEQKN